MRFFFFFLLLGMAFTAHAEIYTCEENGQKTFSQLPCGQETKTVTLSNGAKKVVLNLRKNPNSAEDFCGLATGALDVAVSSGHVGGTKDGVALDRVAGYIRDRIANVSELRTAGVDVDKLTRLLASQVYEVVEDNPTPTSQSLNSFKSVCVAHIEKRLSRLKY